jgi:hypothetical protein
LAFEFLRRRIVASGGPACPRPAHALRSDEIVWGRAPARIDLTGGWTDTPPFALEHGGCVLNAAVELNGQPPIQVYARVTPEPAIRIHSIDLGTDVNIRRWDELAGDYEIPRTGGAFYLFPRAPRGTASQFVAACVSFVDEISNRHGFVSCHCLDP